MAGDLTIAPAQGVLEILSTASRLLSNPQEFEAALPLLAGLMVPAWADGCAIGLWGGDGGVRIVASAGKVPRDRSLGGRQSLDLVVSKVRGG